MRAYDSELQLMGGRLSCGGRSSRRENERSRKSSGCFTLRNSRGNVKARAECHRKTRNRPGSHIYKKQLSRDDPSLLSSAVLINSWKAPSISSMPDTPVSELSSSTKFNCDRPSLSQPTNEMLMQIIRCFPFDVASTYSSPRGSPTASRHVKSANFAAIEVDGMVRRTASWHGTKKLKTSLSNIVRRKTEATFLYVDSETKIAKTKSAIEKLAQPTC
ncbi:hypothetical protein AB6A40_007822 [Gnathostoma spinigerum]|uniref:Uncharacterized protein n=1 Tax=Gnathostoma spinigerum TaxID=75299 RepID=A0ABD6EMD4_9BILA